MKNSFFKPQKEDIYIGYECEFAGWSEGVPKEFTINEGNILTVIRDIGLINVPYLTKEKIIAEGWLFEESDTFEIYGDIKFRKAILIGEDMRVFAHLVYNPDIKHLKIKVQYETGFEQQLVSCDCKDINTFRKICKLLNINS